MDRFVIFIGLLAGFITTLGYVPQVVKGYRSGRMDDVSIFMPVVLMAGMTLWLVYGIALENIPIMFWNAVSVILNGVIIAMKLRCGGKEARPLTAS